MSALMAALKGLAALPDLIKAVERIGDKLDEKAAMERLAEKRDRNRDAVDSVLRGDAEVGQRGEADRTPTISGGSEGGAGTDN